MSTAPLSLDVPEGYLDIPFANDRPHILRYEAGLALDPHLRRLSRVSGAVDRSLALRLRRLQAGRGYVKLGYSSFTDYARERLGLAERTAQDLARLGQGLDRLPLLDQALSEGRLTWTAAHQVARVAGVEDEASWVDRAQSLPVRELKRQVQEALRSRSAARNRTAGEPSGTPTVTEGADPLEDAEAPQDTTVRLRVSVGARSARYWFSAVDLCRMTAGCELADRDACEYMLADFLSGALPLPSPSTPGATRAPVVTRRASARSLRWVRPGGWLGDLPPVAEELGPAELQGELAEEVKQILKLVDSSVEDDLFEMDAAMRRLAAARSGLDLDLARLLRNFHSLNLAPQLGYARFADYVEDRLGISARRARFLVRLDRRLFYYPRIARAVRFGRIGAVAALLLSGVAADQTEDVWISRAEKVPVARLRREVEWADRRRRLSGWRDLALPPPRGRLTTELDVLTDAMSRRDDAGETSVDGQKDRPGQDQPPWTFSEAVQAQAWSAEQRQTFVEAARGQDGLRQTFGDAAGDQGGPRQTFANAAGGQDELRQTFADAAGGQDGLRQTFAGAVQAQGGSVEQTQTLSEATGGQDGLRQTFADAVQAQGGSVEQTQTLSEAAGGQDELRQTFAGAVQAQGGSVEQTQTLVEAARGQDELRQTFADAAGGQGGLLKTLADAAGGPGGPRQTFADAVDAHRARARDDDRDSIVDVAFSLPSGALHLWEEARRQVASLVGQARVSDREVLQWVALDFLSTHLPLWLEAIAHSDPIAVRERFRCAAPGCTVRCGAGHHLRFRSQGGPDEEWNELFLCFTHHLEALHRGYIRISGRAPDELIVELGIKPDGTALEVFVRGERQEVRPARSTVA